MSQESDFSSDGDGTWIEWFCSLEDHFWFCEIDADYIKDFNNLYGIKSQFPSQAIRMILKLQGPQQHNLEDPQFLDLYQDAIDLYGLIHARFILTPKGLNLMREKYLRGEFGQCPRVLCEGQNAIPIGVSEELKTCRVKVYCPRCEDVYNYQPKKKCANIDGAYFGGSFPHILLMSFKDLDVSPSDSKFTPSIFGFKIHGKNGSSVLPTKNYPHPVETQQKHFLEDKSLTKTSVSRPKRKNNKKNK